MWLVGRRGPLQAAFTIAELRELLKLENCKTLWRPEDFNGIHEIIPKLARPRKRITELMLKSLEDSKSDTRHDCKEFRPIFLRSPVEFVGSKNVEKVKFSVNKLEGEDILNKSAKSTNEIEEIPCELSVRSIGYRSVQLDKEVPFDSKKGKIINNSGKIESNLYTSGWVATGPVGVILSTMTNAFQVGKLITNEIKAEDKKSGTFELKKILMQKSIQTVNFQGWEKIDKEECARGKLLNKPREKIVDVNEMLNIALK